MIWRFFLRAFGPKLAMPVIVGLAVSLLLGGVLTLSYCTRDRTAEKQAEQTSASGEAISTAARDAITVLSHRTVNDQDVDRVVRQSQQEIHDAPDVNAVRAAVIAGLCQQESHRHDPACAVR